VVNLNVTVREWADQIVFLHRIVPGATDRSYGIHVAKIAGLPEPVVARAREILGRLSVHHQGAADLAGLPGGNDDAAGSGESEPSRGPRGKRGRQTPGAGAGAGAGGQYSLFTEYLEHPALEELRKTDLDRLSPLEAFDLLRRLRQQVDGGKNSKIKSD
jgi:DNA mismatch repair protein MutS